MMEDNYVDAETIIITTYREYLGVARQAVILSMKFLKPHCKLDIITSKGVLKYQHTKKVQAGKPLYVVFICLSESVKKFDFIKRLTSSWTISSNDGDLPIYRRIAREGGGYNYYYATEDEEAANSCIRSIARRWNKAPIDGTPSSVYNAGVTRIHQSIFDDDPGHFLRYLIKGNKIVDE